MIAATSSDGSGAPALVYKGKKEYKIIGKYMMGEVIGEGMQGKVREALHSETLRRVAIKIVHLRQLRKAQNAEKNMEREMAIHKKLKHRNVVELTEHFRIDEKDKWYVVLELITGGSLQDIVDILPEKRLPDALARRFVHQLLDGLDYCHGKGVVHRDIKPSNLMVNTDGVLKICDFGVAEELETYAEGDLCSKSRGSPAFLPPEVASGSHEKFSGFKVDVWATGVSLYLLTTGRVPFEGTSLINLFENIDQGNYGVPQALASQPQLLSLVDGLLAHEQAHRLSVREALEHAWMSAPPAEEVWGEREKALVASVATRMRSGSVLRSIARMYGEAFVEAPPAADASGPSSTSGRTFAAAPSEHPCSLA
jgi:serine/threonine-protein kinase 11